MLDFSVLIFPLAVFLAFALASFLFWRAGRYELFESDFIFDIVAVSSFGALVIGRIFDFLVHPEIYHWSLKRLAFFNVWGGLDFWGALLGALISIMLYARYTKTNFWQILDLAAAPFAFAMTLVFLGFTLGDIFIKKQVGYFNLYFFIGYLVIFWILKRLAVKKRYPGFFACLFAISVSILNLLAFLTRQRIKLEIYTLYQMLAAAGFLVFGFFSWYILGGRSLRRDFKAILAIFLLAVFASKRLIFSVNEAGELSRTILFSPYYLIRSFCALMKVIIHEIILGLVDFVGAFKIKR